MSEREKDLSLFVPEATDALKHMGLHETENHLTGIERVMLADKLQERKLPLPLLRFVRHLPHCTSRLMSATHVPTDRAACDCGLRAVLEKR